MRLNYTPFGQHDRITIPDDLSEFARASDGKFETAQSDIRRVVPLEAVPWLVMTYDQLRGLPLGGRDGFVLSLVDGRSTVEMILDLAGLPEDDTIGILGRLLEVGAIEMHEPVSSR